MRFLAAALLGVLAASAAAQSWPEKPVRIIAPFAPGGLVDSGARVIAEPLSALLGQPVLVENRSGAGGNLGTQLAAQAAPDGYTLLLAYDGTLVINPHIYSKIPFDTLKDFTPVTKLGDATLILVAHPSVPAKDLAQFIAVAKSATRPYPYGTSGTGNTTHLVGELLSQRAGIPLQHVPYKGGGPAVTDLIGGQIPLVFTAVASAQQHVRTGRLVALAVPSAQRSSALPDVPTFQESGIADFDVASWVGICAPAGTPRAIVDRLNSALATVLRQPQVRERYAALGIEPVGNSPAEFGAQMRADLARWEKVVKAANIRVD
jgi:tripartite-type tricarboxylate transporter receptor subunit TctC